MSATSIHENDDELSAIRQHLSQTQTKGAGALAGEGAGADEGAISATSIHEDDDDEVFEKQQDLSAGVNKIPYEAADKGALLGALAGEGAVEGVLSATSVHEDEIRQHLSHAPRSSILPVLSKTTVS